MEKKLRKFFPISKFTKLVNLLVNLLALDSFGDSGYPKWPMDRPLPSVLHWAVKLTLWLIPQGVQSNLWLPPRARICIWNWKVVKGDGWRASKWALEPHVYTCASWHLLHECKSSSCNLKASQSYLREFWLPKGWAMFPSFDTSFISKNCDWKGCNLGIRLKKNFCNKPLLFCLMVRQKDVYTCIVMLTQRICARPRCCMKKAAMVLFNGPASRKALVENKCCILDRHEKHVL